MLCNNCQKQIPQNISVCPECGAPVNRVIPGFEYTNGVKQSLKSMVDSCGIDVLNDAKRFTAFLNDYLPEYEKERRLIRNVINNDVIKNMIKEKNHNIAIMKAKEYMTSELFLSKNACEFIIECFTYVLGWKYVYDDMDVESPKPVAPVQQQNAQKSTAKTESAVVSSVPAKEFRAFDAMKYKFRGTIEIAMGYTSIEGFCFDCFSMLKAVKLPPTLVTIGEYAFSECKRLKTISLPDSLRVIKKSAFSSCGKLSMIRIPEGVTAIEEGTFAFCQSLEVVELPPTISSIGNEAFSGCERLRNIFIPSSVKFMGDNVFHYCPSLTIQCYENSYVHKYCTEHGLKTELTKKGF